MEVEQTERRAVEELSEPEKTPAIDPYKAMNIVPNPDGSITRQPIFPITPPVDETAAGSACFSKDVTFDPVRGVRVRIFRPNPVQPGLKLPILLFFHGGGFVLFSSDAAPYHATAEALARGLPALVVSVDYRLAPEHRLPAAFDDAARALEWVRDPGCVREPWLRDHGDPARCILMGSSAGANIVYRAALWARGADLSPVKIVGLVFHQPFFGGVDRTASERRLADDRILPLPVTDLMWALSLPDGASRDHEFCNPASPARTAVAGLPRCFFCGCEGDPLVDRQRAFLEMLAALGAPVTGRFRDSGHHAVELFDAGRLDDLVDDVKCFASTLP